MKWGLVPKWRILWNQNDIPIWFCFWVKKTQIENSHCLSIGLSTFGRGVTGESPNLIDFYCGLITILLMIFLGQFKSARNKVRLQSHSRLSDCVLHKESMLFKHKLLHPILHKSNAIFCLNLNYKCDAISGGMAWRSNRQQNSSRTYLLFVMKIILEMVLYVC